MAATYPLEIVKADRWLQDPSHTNLRGDQLAGALEAEEWDPSVKSLVPFPQILWMMDEQLDWTERLGSAVVAQQPDVMDAIQRLRRQAAAAGALWSSAQQTVTTERQGIVIEPANPEIIYPPVYSPAGVYGPWPYPDYPPFDISPFETDFGLQAPFGIGLGVGFVLVRPLSRWCAFDWAQSRILLNVDRFNALNHHTPGIATSTWHRDPFRLSLPSRDFAADRRNSVAPVFPQVGRAPTAVLRSAQRSFALAGGGLQARIGARPGFFIRQMRPPFMPQQSAPSMIPRTFARSTPWVLGGGARFGGVSHR
jgi:hypothetical protein